MENAMNFKKRCGFSMIELLVVLGIVAILTAILFPVYAHARRAGYQAACLSNMAQMQQSIAAYMLDYDGRYPLSNTGASINNATRQFTTWRLLILSYTKTEDWPFACAETDLPGAWNDSRGNEKVSGYALNGQLKTITTYRPGGTIIEKGALPEFALQYPSLTVTITEARPTIVSLSAPDNLPVQDLPASYIGNSQDVALMDTLVYGAKRHNGGSNYSFADGHVKWYKPEMVRKTEKTDGSNPGFGI